MIQTYEAITQYLGWKDRGKVCVDQVEAKGSIAGNKGLLQAKSLGEYIQNLQNIIATTKGALYNEYKTINLQNVV